MADARQVAEDFFDAWTGKDFERARGLLAAPAGAVGPGLGWWFAFVLVACAVVCANRL